MTRTVRTAAAFLAVAVLTLLALVAPSTSASAASAASGSGSAVPGKAWVRVGHFVPGMGAASVQLTPVGSSGTPAMSVHGATYGEVTSYDRLGPGTYTATIRRDGAGAGAPLLSRSVTLVGGDASTVALLGTAQQPRLVLLQDDLTPPKPGTARVRLLSASDAAQSVTVTAVGGPVLAQDTVLGEATGYTTVPDGRWDLQLTSAGAGTMDRSVTLAGGGVYTVIALDSGNGVTLDTVTDARGAMAAPRGGADTGLGGMAPHPTATVAPRTSTLALPTGLLAVLLVGMVGLAVPARRRVWSRR